MHHHQALYPLEVSSSGLRSQAISLPHYNRGQKLTEHGPDADQGKYFSRLNIDRVLKNRKIL